MLAVRVVDGAAAKQLEAETEAKLAEVTVKGYQSLAEQKVKEVRLVYVYPCMYVCVYVCMYACIME
jgi:hypothetical protein